MAEKEYVERNEILKPFILAPDGTRYKEVDCDNFPVTVSLKIIKQMIREVPAADVRPMVRGRWIYKKKLRGGFSRVTGTDDDGNEITITVDNRREVDEPYCSECGKWNDGSNINFCGVCGADMRGKKDV